VIAAAGNWWGDSSGPAHASNPGGAGQGISDNVSYDNFLLNSNCVDAIYTPTPTPTPAVCQPSGSVQGSAVVAQNPTNCVETPTPEPRCPATLRDPIDPPYETINLWDRPDGSRINQLLPGTPVHLIDGVQRNSGWWWHLRLVDDEKIEGYVHETVINDGNNCVRVIVEPPPPPGPMPNEACFVNLVAQSAEVREGSGESHQTAPVITTITTPAENIRVYGTSYDRSLLLISAPGDALPQRWVLRSLFAPNPPNARACLNTVLGRFRREGTSQVYWSAVGAYANTFSAPVNYTTDYAVYRNSYHYIPGQHAGTDIVYRPPDGTGDSVPFSVYAQANGVIVDAGPDGITRVYQFERTYTGITQPPGNRFVGSAGVFYWAEQLSTDSWRETYYVAMIGSVDDDPANDDSERPNNDYFSFGITQKDYEGLIRDGFSQVCTRVAGCIDGPGRQVIIWYSLAGQNQLRLQTVYYHVSVDELSAYQQLRSICSVNRDSTWNAVFIQNDTDYEVCRVNAGEFLGRALLIGFSNAPHLHYEIYVDRDNNGRFDKPGDREDALMAFATIR
jgi:hypothetical protein